MAITSRKQDNWQIIREIRNNLQEKAYQFGGKEEPDSQNSM